MQLAALVVYTVDPDDEQNMLKEEEEKKEDHHCWVQIVRWEVRGLQGMPCDYHANEDELRDLVEIEQSQVGDGRQPLENGPFQRDGGQKNGEHGL